MIASAPSLQPIDNMLRALQLFSIAFFLSASGMRCQKKGEEYRPDTVPPPKPEVLLPAHEGSPR